MPLTPEKFDRLATELELDAYKQPARFRQRVMWLSAIGYGYILLVIFFLGCLLAILPTIHTENIPYGSIWVGCALVVVIILLGIIVRSLWVRFSPPTGQKLCRQEAPQLFELVEELAVKFETPKFHTILLTDELNARVFQRPLLGIFGCFRNYLLVGLPLMESLSLDQFRAILAHEFGHLSRGDSRFATWIYRIREVWVQLEMRLENHYRQSQSSSGLWYIDILMLFANGVGFLLFGWFFEWFVGRFCVYAFVLSRVNEYEADRRAANWVGDRYLAESLVSMYVKQRYLDRVFWREIYQQADLDPQVPDAIPLMLQKLKTELPIARQDRWLKAALSETTDTIDTHPCLTERLAALGYLDRVTELLNNLAIAKSAAAELFSQDYLATIVARANERWQTANRGVWQSRTDYLQYIAPKLLELEQKSVTKKLTFDEKWDLCRWTADVKGNEAAIPLVRELLAEKSYYAPANYLLGKILIDREDEAGIRYLESAVSCDVELTVSSYELIWEFIHNEHGETDRVKYYREAIEQYYLKRM